MWNKNAVDCRAPVVRTAFHEFISQTREKFVDKAIKISTLVNDYVVEGDDRFDNGKLFLYGSYKGKV